MNVRLRFLLGDVYIRIMRSRAGYCSASQMNSNIFHHSHFLLTQTQPSYTELFFFLWYISQTHSCVNAAGPELAARCVKAKESLPLLRGRIHQNHQGIAKVEQLSPSKESAKKNRRRKKVAELQIMCYCCFSPDFLFHPLLFPNSNYTCSFLSPVASLSLWKTLQSLQSTTFNSPPLQTAAWTFRSKTSKWYKNAQR